MDGWIVLGTDTLHKYVCMYVCTYVGWMSESSLWVGRWVGGSD